MTTPLIMLLLMTAPYTLARGLALLRNRTFDGSAPATVGLGLLFIFTGIGHFTQTAPMTQMLPDWVPARTPLVYVTGILEFAIALAFFVPRTRRLAGGLAAIVLVVFFPANIYAAIQHVPMGGHAWGPVYLLIRAPLQAAILAWVYWFTLRPRPMAGESLEDRIPNSARGE
jgi:uncharacterized membrane protein